MAFVIDASIVHAWVLAEARPEADAIKLRLENEDAVAPSLWWFEVRNGLVMAERRGRLPEAGTAMALHELDRLLISLDRTPDEDSVLTLARRHRLTVYDASYLELAIRMGLALATLDTPLANAARGEAVPVIGDAGA